MDEDNNAQATKSGVRMSELAFFGAKVLKIMSKSPYKMWVIDDISVAASELGLAEVGGSGRLLILGDEVLGTPDIPEEWAQCGDTVGLLYEGDYTHSFSGFIEVGDPMRSDEEVDDDHPERLAPMAGLQVFVTLGDTQMRL